MKTNYRIISIILALTFIVGGVYVYYRAIPPKGKATGIVELPEQGLRKIDKVFKLADINNDRLAEIILLKTFSEDMSRLYLLDVRGNLFIGWPQDGKCPAIGDVNNDGYKKIIDILDNKIYVYDQSGVQLSGFPVNLEKQSATPPVLADLDNNGALEIICGSNMPMPVINVVDGNGYFLEGWQEKIVMPTAKTGYPFSLAAGDINNDGEVEIVALASDRIFVFNRQGEVISRSSVLGLQENREDMVTQLILGDFNLDKILEIVLVYGNELSVRNVDSELFKIKMENNVISCILGDSNGDNLPEIVLTMPDQKIFVYDSSGGLINGWPKDKVIGTPVVGDINSDGINEVVVIRKPFSDYEISAYDINGKPINGWPISLMYSVNSTLALGDIDDDRLIEIVFADTEDNIRIIKTCGIVTTGTWPEIYGGIYNNWVWLPEYMLIDKEREVGNKEDVFSEASSTIPEFIQPEFKLLVSSKDLELISVAEEVAITEEKKKGKPDVGILPIPVNLALDAHITASSEYSQQYKAQNIADGLLGQWDEGEWASSGEQTPWIRLGWDSTQTINTIVLYDRPNRFDEVLNARLDFSDGSSIITGMLPNSGSPKKIIFNDKNVNWVKLQILEGAGSLNTGIAEIEVFYDKPIDSELNLSRKAHITASSEYSSTYKALNITDGLLGQWDEGEWASSGEQTPWIKLSWDNMQTINTVILYDRPNRYDEVLNARLDFSDGSSIITGMLPNSGSPKEIIFNDRNVTWVKFQILEGSGSLNAGLAELEIFFTDKRKNQDNLAMTAKVTASSTFSPKYEPTKVIDGQLGQWDAGEWASCGERTPWIMLSWDTPQTADMILLYDRPNRFDEVLNARLEFSDGSTIVTGMLPNSGAPKQIIFKTKTFDWVRLQILEGSDSLNAGLAEFEVFYSKQVLKSQKEARENNVLINNEITKLKNIDPSLIYTITDPKFVDGRLTSYTCRVTNSIGTIDRTIYGMIIYNKEGEEIGWSEYGRIEDGRIQYREAVTDSAGSRSIWFAKAIAEEGTIGETAETLKQMAKQVLEEKEKQALIDKEIANLKNMDPALIYKITDPEFIGGKLTRYACFVTNSLGTIRRTVYMQIFYDELGMEVGGAEYGRIEDGRLQYRLWKANKDGGRQIILAESFLDDDAILLREMARVCPIRMHYIKMYASCSNLITGDKVAEEEEKLAIDNETAKLKNMDPSLIYTITKPKFVKGKLISYTCQVTNSIGTINRTVYGEIYYNESGSEIRFAECGMIEDGRLQYRLAKTNKDGNRQIIFAKAFKNNDAILLKELARAALSRIGVKDIGLLYVPMPISIQPEDGMPEKWKEILVDKEIAKLKNMDPVLIYTITEPEFMNLKLVSYTCQVTNSIGTINRTVHGEIYYNEAGEEIYYAEYGLIEDGRTQYRLSRTNSDGNRQIIYAKAVGNVWDFEIAIDILRKILNKDKTDEELINTLMLVYSFDIIPKIVINDFVYQLQDMDLEAIGKTRFDMVIIDYSQTPHELNPQVCSAKQIPIYSPIHIHQDTSEKGRFTLEQITALKNSPGGPKTVLAYMSIGEAENYRWYWKNKWDRDNDGKPDPCAPSWLETENSDRPGNYKVRYWEPGWQAIIYGSPTSYLDKIIEAGFDGVYLSRLTAEQEMVDFVKAIAFYARVIKGKADFLIIPQNGEGLSSHPDYVQVVDGIGKEETWGEAIANIDVFKQAKKFVLVIEYVTRQDLIDDFYTKAIEKGYIPYATERDLDVLSINPGHEPD